MNQRKISVSSVRRFVSSERKEFTSSLHHDTIKEEDGIAPKTRTHATALGNFRRVSRSVSLMGIAGKIMTGQDKPSKPKVNMENTYKMSPGVYGRFNQPRVERMLDNILSKHLEGKTYDPKTAPTLTLNIAEIIKEKAKLMGFERHKIIANVVIGSVADQGMEISSRCLWDTKNDGFATTYFRTGSLCAVATVYGVYFE